MDKPELLLMSQRQRDRLKVLHEVQRGHLTQKQAGAHLGLTARWVRKPLRRLKEEGDPGVTHRSSGRPSNRRLPEASHERAVACVREVYGDFGPTLAMECLAKRDRIPVSKETLRKWLIEAGYGRRGRAGSKRCTLGGRGGSVEASWCNGTPPSMPGWKGKGRSRI